MHIYIKLQSDNPPVFLAALFETGSCLMKIFCTFEKLLSFRPECSQVSQFLSELIKQLLEFWSALGTSENKNAILLSVILFVTLIDTVFVCI